MNRINRRRVLQAAAAGGITLPFLLRRIVSRALADPGAPERYFLHLFLVGAADGFLAVDPVVGDKATSGAFDPTHTSAPFAPTAVAGKSALSVGLGLAPAAPAFAAMPTAFVRGLFIEVTAHLLAERYNYSGRPSLSETRAYPTVAQVMANTAGGFPAHVILGNAAPLVDTTTNAPPVAPLQASSAEALHLVLDRPGRTIDAKGNVTEAITDASFAAMEDLLKQLDAKHLAGLSQAAQGGLETWFAAQGATGSLYAQNLGSKMVPDPDMLTRYGSKKSGDFGDLLAGVSKGMQAGICNYFTVSAGSFDTHSNHFALHVPLMQEFAGGLTQLVADLKAAPAKTGGTLADKTTILISTDFGRTPKLNTAEGTDHFQSGWAVVMGAGVKDNALVGATDANGEALGWAGRAAVARTAANALLPEHLIATVLRILGFPDAAKIVSETNLDELAG